MRFGNVKVSALFIGVAVATVQLGAAGLARADAPAFMPVCERTEVVREWLEAATQKTCDQIVVGDLGVVVRIAVPNKGVTAFKVGDFSGLPNLQILNIKGNPFTTLPEGIFAGLSSLKTLVLFRTGLVTVPDDFLVGLDNLENLHMFGNPFTAVPAEFFERIEYLHNLRIVDFNDNLNAEQKQKLQVLFPAGGNVELNFY